VSTALAPIGDFPLDLPNADAAGAGAFPDFPAPSLGTPNLSRGQKAAIIVRLLLSDGAELPISDFPEDLQHTLTRSMGSMKSISRETMTDVIDEFISEIESVGMFFPGGLDGALKVLEGALSPSMVTRLRREAGGVFYGDPWEKVIDLPLEVLLSALETEAIEVCAVMLSKLAVPRAAELLGMVEGTRARRIAYAISQTKAVTPEAVRRIGVSLANQLNNQPPVAFDDDPVDRVGAILNFAPANRRDEVLDGLDEDDKEFGALVRKAIFTFANIPQRIHSRDMPKVIRGIDQADLVTALAAAKQQGDQKGVDFVLDNMSKRLSATIVEEMAEVGTIKSKDGDEAQAKIVAAVRALEAAGEIFMRMDDDEEEG
jgi:flagellar motor switch protein FliG